MTPKKKISNAIIVFGIISTSIAGLFFNIFPGFSLIFLISGIVILIVGNLKTEDKLDTQDFINRTIAKSLSMQGLGNPYSEAYFANIQNNPKANKDSELIEKAFEIDSNDENTVSLYCVNKALELSFEEWQGRGHNEKFKQKLSALKNLINDKINLFPKNPYLYNAQGIILDIEGKHKLARDAFKKQGLLDDGPYWRIPVLTSFLKEGLYDSALEELKKAKDEGLENVNIHYGKIYQAKGDYKESVEYFKKALSCDIYKKRVMRGKGWKAEVLGGIGFGLYCQGKFIHGSVVRIELGLYLLFNKALKQGAIEILDATTKILIRLVFLGSKLLIPVYTKFPSSQVIAMKIPPDRFEYLIGTQLLDKQHFKAASALLKKVVEINKKLNNLYMVAINSLHLGNCYLSQDVFLAEVETLYKESLKLFEILEDCQGIAKSHWMLSEFYGAKGNSAGQNEHHIKALEYFKKTGVSEKEVEEQSVLSEIGFDSKRLNAENITVTNNEYKVGKNIIDDLINLSLEDLGKYFIPFEKDFADIPAAIISAYNNMASKLTKIGEYDKAEMLYNKAIKHCDDSTPKGKIEIAMILNNLAGIHVEKKQHKKAKEVMEKAKIMIENIDTDEVEIFRCRMDNNMTILDRKIAQECSGNYSN